jgi:hypothetical protein
VSNIQIAPQSADEAVAPKPRANDAKLVYGQDPASGRLIHVKHSQRGARCGLCCARCGKGLIARQGGYVRWHFAHESNAECANAVETAIHLRAKQIIAESQSIAFPKLTNSEFEKILQRSQIAPDFIKILRPRFRNSDSDLAVARDVSYAKADMEVPYSGFKPDVVLRRDKDCIVEIHVTHATGADKRDRLQAAQLTAIEIHIDVGFAASIEDVEYATYVLQTAPREYLSLSKTAIEFLISRVPEKYLVPPGGMLLPDLREVKPLPWEQEYVYEVVHLEWRIRDLEDEIRKAKMEGCSNKANRRIEAAQRTLDAIEKQFSWLENRREKEYFDPPRRTKLPVVTRIEAVGIEDS